ncbi:MAG: hypothetical protein AAF039_11700 [Bacteroidota bacterium]
MKKLLKPACLLFNILALVLFFFLGLLYAGWIEAGKNQGLAGGAIVLGYGVLFAIVALFVSFFVTYRLRHKYVIRANVILGILILASVLLIKNNADARRTERKERESQKTTGPKDQNNLFALSKVSLLHSPKIKTRMGLGFFKPKLQEEHPMYFYGNPNVEKSLQEHVPTDSIVFKRNEISFQITSAPPWLIPEHLKLDYDLILFKVFSVGEEFVRVEANSNTGYSAYVSRWAGDLIFWPDFLLNAHSVEFINPSEQKVRIKPLQNASMVNVSFDFMRPILINENWAKVTLLDSDQTKKGEGWIQWKKDDRLLISYSLLS